MKFPILVVCPILTPLYLWSGKILYKVHVDILFSITIHHRNKRPQMWTFIFQPILISFILYVTYKIVSMLYSNRYCKCKSVRMLTDDLALSYSKKKLKKQLGLYDYLWDDRRPSFKAKETDVIWSTGNVWICDNTSLTHTKGKTENRMKMLYSKKKLKKQLGLYDYLWDDRRLQNHNRFRWNWKNSNN
jgi:hypothetical protein